MPEKHTDTLGIYLREIGQHPLLTREEEILYSRKVQQYAEMRSLIEKNPSLRLYLEILKETDILICKFKRMPSIKEIKLRVRREGLEQIIEEGDREWGKAASKDISELKAMQVDGALAMHRMLQANLRLVVSVAKKYSSRNVDLLDLIQEGNLGLKRAVEKFDPAKGYRFSTYAYWWIRQSITRCLYNDGRTVRLPVHMTEQFNKIKSAYKACSQRNGKPATLKQVAEHMKVTEEYLRSRLAFFQESISLDLKVGKEQDVSLVDLICSVEVSEIDDIDMHDQVANLMVCLTPRERYIVSLRFGLEGEPKTLAEIGRTINVSRERVRQMEEVAMRKLRKFAKQYGIGGGYFD